MLSMNATPKSVTQVNAVLKSLGIEERLHRGKGYFYFIEGKSTAWYTSTVSVFRISSYTVAGWLEQYILLRWADMPRWKVEFRADGRGLVIVNRDYFDKKNYGTVVFTSDDVVSVLNFLSVAPEAK